MKTATRFLLALALTATGLTNSSNAALVIVGQDATNRIISNLSGNVYFDYFSSFYDGINKQHSLVYTSNATFLAALQNALGPLGGGQSYQINSASFSAGNETNGFGVPEATVHKLLVPFNTLTVTWNNFNSGGQAGVDYDGTALTGAPTVVGVQDTQTTTWSGASLASLVQDWLDSNVTNYGLFFKNDTPNAVLGTRTYTSPNTLSWTLDVVIVPEPASALLGGIGSLLLLRRRR